MNSLLLRVNLVKTRNASLVMSCQGLPLTFWLTLSAGAEEHLECVSVLLTLSWPLRKRKMELREPCRLGERPLTAPRPVPEFAGAEQGCGANAARWLGWSETHRSLSSPGAGSGRAWGRGEGGGDPEPEEH